MIRAILCLLFTSALLARADSWMSPREYECFSENKRFVATITPASDKAKAEVKVSEVKGKERKQLWRSNLSNRTAPTEAFVSDEGKVVVTLNNWGRVGYGDDIVAVYGPEGQRAKYSLEQIAPLPIKKGGPEEVPIFGGSGYHSKFSHSTSSRHWDQDSIEFFASKGGDSSFCIWLDWENRWVAFRERDGKLIKPSANQTQDWNIRGRQIALRELNDKSTFGAAEFLGKLRYKEDRYLIEAWLGDTNFYGGWMDGEQFTLLSGSSRRERADRILNDWDMRRTRTQKRSHDDQTYFLGTINGTVQLTSAPKETEGTLHIYLIPHTVPLDQLDAYRPSQYLTADLSHARPWDSKTSKPGKLDSKINFIISHVTPGKYRLRAIWDKAKPFCGETMPCSPLTGDFISSLTPVIEVVAGKETGNVTVECTQSVR